MWFELLLWKWKIISFFFFKNKIANIWDDSSFWSCSEVKPSWFTNQSANLFPLKTPLWSNMKKFALAIKLCDKRSHPKVPSLIVNFYFHLFQAKSRQFCTTKRFEPLLVEYVFGGRLANGITLGFPHSHR